MQPVPSRLCHTPLGVDCRDRGPAPRVMVGMRTASQNGTALVAGTDSRNRGFAVLIVAFPKYAFWPLMDWSVAFLDTLREALGVGIPALLDSRED